MKRKEAQVYIISTLIFAVLILAIIMYGQTFLTYVSKKSGYAAAKQESQYMIVPVTLGKAAFHVFIADTEERRRLGLSYRETLSHDTGMFFVFDSVDKHGIWMKDMKFPIDVLWLDKKLQVVHIEKEVAPESYPHIFTPPVDAQFVLEMHAGFSDMNSIATGTEMVLYR